MNKNRKVMGKYYEYIDDDKFATEIEKIISKCRCEIKHNDKVNDPIASMFERFYWSGDSDALHTIIKRRQLINMAIGNMHQSMMGYLPGCTNLRTGHKSKMDIHVSCTNIYIELKNRSNTMNSDSKASVINKCKNILNNDKTASCYICMMQTEDEDMMHIVKQQKTEIPRLYQVSGKKMYEILTGDPDAYRKLIIAFEQYLKEHHVYTYLRRSPRLCKNLI